MFFFLFVLLCFFIACSDLMTMSSFKLVWTMNGNANFLPSPSSLPLRPRAPWRMLSLAFLSVSCSASPGCTAFGVASLTLCGVATNSFPEWVPCDPQLRIWASEPHFLLGGSFCQTQVIVKSCKSIYITMHSKLVIKSSDQRSCMSTVSKPVCLMQ